MNCIQRWCHQLKFNALFVVEKSLLKAAVLEGESTLSFVALWLHAKNCEKKGTDTAICDKGHAVP